MDKGGRKRVIPTLQAWALRDRRKGDPTASVVGKKMFGMGDVVFCDPEFGRF